MNAQPSPAAAQAIAAYESILASYQTESARLAAQGIDPSSDPRVLELYQASVAAHGRIAEAYAADEAAAAAPVAAAAAPVGTAAVMPDVAPQAQPVAAPAGTPPVPAPLDEVVPLASGEPEPLAELDLELDDVVLDDLELGDFDLSEPAPAAPPVAAVPQPEQGGVLGRRPGIDRFLPPPTDSSAPLRRDVLAARRTDTRPQLSRERKIAGDLPAWNPEPPNEVLQVSPRR